LTQSTIKLQGILIFISRQNTETALCIFVCIKSKSIVCYVAELKHTQDDEHPGKAGQRGQGCPAQRWAVPVLQAHPHEKHGLATRVCPVQNYPVNGRQAKITG
jgi:hypothetical protein